MVRSRRPVIVGVVLVSIRLNRSDLAQVHFVPGPLPLLEVLNSIRALCRDRACGRLTEWQARVTRRLPPVAQPLMEMMSGCDGAPMFMAPLEPDLQRALTVVCSIPDQVVERSLAATFGERGVPKWVTAFVAGSGTGRRRLRSSLQSYFTSCLLPYWDAVKISYEWETMRFSRTVLLSGVKTAFEELTPEIRWQDEGEVDLRGREVLLAPSPFWTGEPVIRSVPDGRAVLIYAPPAPLTVEPAASRQTTLEHLLGQTRAAVLSSLTTPCGTTELAERVGMSVATTSEHASILRATGLVITARQGRSVQHSLTRLGRLLLQGGAEDAA